MVSKSNVDMFNLQDGTELADQWFHKWLLKLNPNKLKKLQYVAQNKIYYDLELLIKYRKGNVQTGK